MSKPKMWKEIYMTDAEIWEGDRFHSAWYTVDDIVRSSTRYKTWLEVISVAKQQTGKFHRAPAEYGAMLARGAILALIAYDDAGQYLEWDPEKLETMSILTESPTQFLMLPAVKVFNQQLVHG
jgi:hypothetical protein